MKLVAVVLIPIVLVLWLLAPPAEGRDLTHGQQRARQAILDVFPKALEREALAVSWCESRWYIHATNGQYRGLFQVSGHWRRTVPGWAPGGYAQARHALAVYRITGSTWRHWECRWAV